MAHYDCEECGCNMRQNHAPHCSENPYNQQKDKIIYKRSGTWDNGCITVKLLKVSNVKVTEEYSLEFDLEVTHAIVEAINKVLEERNNK